MVEMENNHFHVIEENACAGPMEHSIVEGVAECCVGMRWLANLVGPGSTNY